MSETKELIQQLNDRVDKLLTRIAESNQAAEKKEQEIVSLKKQVSEKDNQLVELKAEVEKAIADLKQAEVGNENEELKTRINEMVREIDECISLLKVEN